MQSWQSRAESAEAVVSRISSSILTGPPQGSANTASRPERIVSVDALRGFDMFWIIGGEQVAEALDRMGGGPIVSAIVVDVWCWRKWCLPFLWIGSNALTAYLAMNLVDFRSIAARFVGGDIQAFLDAHVAVGFGGLIVAAVGLLLPILLVRFLYQEKIFIRL
jgi:hypothetical protein